MNMDQIAATAETGDLGTFTADLAEWVVADYLTTWTPELDAALIRRAQDVRAAIDAEWHVRAAGVSFDERIEVAFSMIAKAEEQHLYTAIMLTWAQAREAVAR